MQRLRPWLTKLYPRAWRARYGAEFDALLEQCLRSPLDAVDVFLGAIDAHLQLLTGEDVTWRMMNMLNKIRTTILIVFTAYIGFIIAGFSLLGLADDSPMIPLMKTDLALKAAWTAVQLGAGIGFIAVVVGGMPLAFTIIRRIRSANRRDLRLLLVPVYALLALSLYAGFILLVGSGRVQIPGVIPSVQPDNFPIGNKLMLAGLMLIFIAGAAASTFAVWKVVSNTEVEQETFRVIGRPVTVKLYTFAFLPAVIATGSMLGMLVGTVVWGWLAFTALPDVWVGNFGPWLTSTQAWFIGIVALMTVCTAAAFIGVLRGRSARLSDNKSK